MTVPSAAARSGPYDGPGSTFDYTFYIGAASELLVTKTSTAGVDSTLTVDTDYTVSIGDDGTGTFTLTTALVEDEKVTATLNLDIEQATDLVNTGQFYAETHEAALDYIVRICKMQQEQLDRCLKIAVSSDTDVTELSYDDFVKRPTLLDEETVSNAATLDVGDLNVSGWYNYYHFLRVDFTHVQPATDGDILQYRVGGGGSWWATANYDGVDRQGAYSGQTEVAIWANIAGLLQGNGANETAFGEILIELAESTAQQTGRGMRGKCSWLNDSAEPRFQSFHWRYPTTDHVSAVRLWYAGGNISGTAQLWGLPID